MPDGTTFITPEKIDTMIYRAAIYARVSTDRQEEDGTSLVTQNPGFRWKHVPFLFMVVPTPDGKPTVANPIHHLNALLHEVMKTGNGSRWTRLPEHGKEQLYHFLYFLRQTMKHLADNPIGKKSTLSASEVARMLTHLPRHAAFVHSGDTTGVIYTDKTAPPCSHSDLGKRYYLIKGQTRQKYCTFKEAPMENRFTDSRIEPQLSRWDEVQ